MKIRSKTTPAIALAAAMIASGAHATIISVNFDTGNLLSSTEGGAPGVRVANWNAWANVNDLSNVVNSDGDLTAVTATVNSTNRSQRGNPAGFTNEQIIFTSVIDVQNSNTVTVSNVPYASYDVYVYMRDDANDRAGSFQIGGTTYYVRGLTGGEGGGDPDNTGSGYVLSTDTTVDLTNPGTIDVDNSIDQGNYVKFSGLSGSSFDLIAGAVDTSDAANRNKFAGFQIVQVPEPSVTLLGALGLLGLLRRRR